jgi:protein-L-isoaspartate(D-aspartate) O-methyltransferase
VIDYAALRERMVREQIEARGVKDPRVLSAMRETPRHLFVMPGNEPYAYDDRPLAIGHGQTISQPLMVALMTEALRPAVGHRVLEVGTGSGYQAAVIARLVSHVVTIERHPALADSARRALTEAGITNVRVVVGDGSEGLAIEAPFDGIIVTAGAPAVPDPLKEQLADGGRLVIPVGPAQQQTLTIVRRRGDEYEIETDSYCSFVPLLGRFGWKE